MRNAILAAVLALAACGDKSYDSAGDVLKAQAEAGFVRLGTFGDVTGPCQVVEEQTAQDEIAFTLANGTQHRYPGYTGFTLKVLRVHDAQGNELVYVLRSRERS